VASLPRPGRIEVPVSVVAVLAAASRTTVDGASSAEVTLVWTPEEFACYVKQVWTSVVRHRPDLSLPLYPLMAWLLEEPAAGLVSQAHEVARAALRAGQVDLTGTPRRQEVDLLGAVVTVLRSALSERASLYPCLCRHVDGVPGRGEGGRVSTMGTGDGPMT
jgi:hypothetical protein